MTLRLEYPGTVRLESRGFLGAAYRRELTAGNIGREIFFVCVFRFTAASRLGGDLLVLSQSFLVRTKLSASSNTDPYP